MVAEAVALDPTQEVSSDTSRLPQPAEDSNELFFADADGYFPFGIRIRSDMYSVRLDHEKLAAAADHLSRGERRYGIWPHAADRHPLDEIIIRDGGSAPSWQADLQRLNGSMSGQLGDVLPAQIFSVRTGQAVLSIPRHNLTLSGKTPDQTAREMQRSLNEQLDAGLLQRTGANIVHRRWLNAFYASLGTAVLAGIESGQLEDFVSTPDRIRDGLIAGGVITAFGGLAAFLGTRRKNLNRSAIFWANRRLKKGTDRRWLATDHFENPILTLIKQEKV